MKEQEKVRLYWSKSKNFPYETAYDIAYDGQRGNGKWWMATVTNCGHYMSRAEPALQPWPEGIETLEGMKAYIETLFRMGEL